MTPAQKEAHFIRTLALKVFITCNKRKSNGQPGTVTLAELEQEHPKRKEQIFSYMERMMHKGLFSASARGDNIEYSISDCLVSMNNSEFQEYYNRTPI